MSVGPVGDQGPDVEMGNLVYVLQMDVQVEEDLPHGEGALEEEGSNPQVWSYDSFLGEIKELKFLLRKSQLIFDYSHQDNQML